MRSMWKILMFGGALGAGAVGGAAIPAAATGGCCECEEESICSQIDFECRTTAGNSSCRWNDITSECYTQSGGTGCG